MDDNNKKVEGLEDDKKVAAEPDKDQQPKDDKKYTDAEVDEIINRKYAKWKLEQDASVQKQIEEAVAKAKMSDEELEALKEQERQDAIKAMQEENETLKAQIAHRNMQDLAIKELEKQGVPVNESTLAFVVKDDEEATKLAVTNMANILNIKKRDEAKSNPPKTSGGSDDSSNRGKDKFASAKITNF